MAKRFKHWKKPVFKKDGMTKWHWKCQNHENLVLGQAVDIGAFSYLNARYGIELEDNVQIGSHCSLYSISTIDNKKGKVFIGENTRIGTHSVIMPGVKVGKNSVIGAFSFVNKDIPDSSLAYGIPVKVIKKLK